MLKCVIKIAGEGECLREKERGTRERMSERDDHIKERQKMKAFRHFLQQQIIQSGFSFPGW